MEEFEQELNKLLPLEDTPEVQSQNSSVLLNGPNLERMVYVYHQGNEDTPPATPASQTNGQVFTFDQLVAAGVLASGHVTSSPLVTSPEVNQPTTAAQRVISLGDGISSPE